jgi:uncharacterized protein DUF1592/uncharacterized protein DUF1588/uncharacterized protein DUF1595/uncharacterized protein DUF1587/uncharacterized protein DUF1585
MMARLRHWSAVAAVAAGLSACTGSVGDPAAGGPGGPNPPGTGSPTPGPGGGAPGAEQPGRTPMRRLTHDEYNNTIRDLLGLTDDFAGAFSGDEDAGGFAANTVSPVTEAQADQYHAAAETIANKAVAAGLNKLAPCAAAAAPDACVQDFVRNFGRRAFRRPLTPDEVARYKQVYTTGATGADFGSGIALVMTAMLQSPNFLYLPERGDRKAAEKDGLPLDPYETAARLSYFVTGSMPDPELSTAADQGALRTVDQVAAQTKRLLGTPQARNSVASFYFQLLEMTDLATVDKDAKLYPQYTPAVRAAMTAELNAFASRTTLEGDGKLETLLTTSQSYPTAALAPIYGLADASAANGTAPVALPKGQRSGLLTLPAVMAVYAQPDQTRPVGRGFLVADKFLCNTPPPAPDNVPMLPPPAPNVTTRERLEKHRSDPACATCHALFDPYGLTFEIYDAIGRYRATESGKPIDASGKGLPGGFADVKDATGLLPQLARSETVRTCLVKQWFRYAMGRVEGTQDDATLTAARAAFARADFGVRDLLVGLATTRGFRYRALPQP